jgi:peptidoglycan DL-endopeptidase CwlO
VPSDISPRWPLARLLTFGTCLLAALLVTLCGRAALAAPSPAQIEAQINQAWNTLEPLIEQYNRVHGQLQDNQAKAAALQKQIQPLALQVDIAMTRVGAMSAGLYMTGPGYRTAALVTSGAPGAMLDELTMFDQMAHQQTAAVAGVAHQRDKYLAAKKPYDDLVNTLSIEDADLAAKKNAIEAQLNQLQQLRAQAYGAAGVSIGKLRPVATCPVVYYGDKGSLAAKKACSLIGKPYIWAASGPKGYDCSGLTLAAWGSVGVTLGHFTGWQWNETKPISRADLRPGDLVFFFSDHHHVGIYVGNGWMVHAPTQGDYVRMAKMDSPYLPIPAGGYRRPG